MPPGAACALARSRPKGRQAELPFEGSGPGGELLEIPGGRVNPKGLRMDLIGRNVDVLVVRIAVTHGDVLVVRKPRRVGKLLHNAPWLSPVEASIFWVERDDKVVGAVFPGPCILCLDGLDESAGELDVMGRGHTREICSQGPGCSGSVALSPDVARELTKALSGCR